VDHNRSEMVSTEILMGAILVLVGAVLLLAKLDFMELRDLAKLWPVSIIGVGIYQLLEHKQKSQAR